MQNAQRPRLTLKILLYAIFDAVGMVCFATGAMWFAQGKSLFISGFPTGIMEALAVTVGGLALMLWAAARILRELLKRPANSVQESN
jgi:hypothetical protein